MGMASTTNAYHQLLQYGIKPSQQRIAIMDYLLGHCTHPSVETIYADLNRVMPTLSKTTIYNTLKLFAEQGAAQMLTIDGRNICYDGNTSRHAHFLCKKCGRIYDLPLDASLAMAAGAEGHVVSEVHQYYKGVCRECMEKDCE